MNKRKIVIVGGGTAGWMTALYMGVLYSKDEVDVTLVESEEIGILGAGEGTTGTFLNFLKKCKINLRDFYVECNATNKLGISFENWNGDNQNYFHSFGPSKIEFDVTEFKNNIVENEFFASVYLNKLDIDNNLLSNFLSKANKSPYSMSYVAPEFYNVDFAYHFDAHLVGKFLRKVAEERGVKRVEGIVVDFKQKENGDITKIILKDELELNCDFVFDCSGFKRLIIGNLYKTKWKSYEENILSKSALTFALPQYSNKIEPYTKSIALKHGWMWQIPLKNRIGCGYVYHDDFTNRDEAHQELEKYFGKSIEPLNNIKFNSGRHTEVWVNNCIAVGLSSGFIEPLEASSLMMAAFQLFHISRLDLDIILPFTRNTYNFVIGSMNDDIKDFVHFHYLTQRNDSKFWKEFSQQTKLSDYLKRIKNEFQQGFFTREDITYYSSINNESSAPISSFSWLAIANGLNLINKNIYTNWYKEHPYRRQLDIHFYKIFQLNKDVVDRSLSEFEYNRILQDPNYKELLPKKDPVPEKQEFKLSNHIPPDIMQGLNQFLSMLPN